MTALLEVRGLVRRFGGLIATNNLSFDVAEGELHALIGPNGAGKSTAIGLISGEQRPDAGQIRFAGADVTALPIAARVKAGMTRSFQITSVLPDFTARENVALVCQVRAGHSFRFWRRAADARELLEPAEAMLARTGLAGREQVPARDLAHGEQRQLELAMALATGAKLLLLDEPMAGLGATESRAMTAILAGLKGHATILLVEHDMDAVFALADRITVLVYGQAIASGPPEAIRANAAVRDAYLGEEA